MESTCLEGLYQLHAFLAEPMKSSLLEHLLAVGSASLRCKAVAQHLPHALGICDGKLNCLVDELVRIASVVTQLLFGVAGYS